jgi:hypothetical protein
MEKLGSRFTLPTKRQVLRMDNRHNGTKWVRGATAKGYLVGRAHLRIVGQCNCGGSVCS